MTRDLRFVKNRTLRAIWAMVDRWIFTSHQSPLAIVAVQFEKLDGRRVLELDAELAGDLAQCVIEVRKVIDGHIANKGAANFIVASAAVQPAKKEEQLKARGKANDDPVGIHRRMGAEAIFGTELACNFYESLINVGFICCAMANANLHRLTRLRRSSLFCHSERSEESLFDLTP